MSKDYTNYEEKKVTRTRPHTVSIDNRERLVMTGVDDVDSFNEIEVVLITETGSISILGNDLHITRLNLDEGQLIVEGYIQALEYHDDAMPREKSGFLGRIFR